MYEVHAFDIRKRDVWDEDEACEGMLVKHEFQIAYEKGKIRNTLLLQSQVPADCHSMTEQTLTKTYTDVCILVIVNGDAQGLGLLYRPSCEAAREMKSQLREEFRQKQTIATRRE